MRCLGFAFALASVWCCAFHSLLARDAPAEPSDKPARQCVITLIDEQSISAVISGVDDGKLVLSAGPQSGVPLVDVERIEFGKTIVPAGEMTWIGQDNYDQAQASASWGGNDIQDLHIRASNLKPLAIKQLTVESNLNGQMLAWRRDPTGSPHWRLAINRGELAPRADIYFEPPEADCFGLSFEVTVTYADGSTTKSTTVVHTHTSNKLKVNRNAQFAQVAPASEAQVASQVFLLDQTQLTGEVLSITPETMTLSTPWRAELKIPLVRVQGIWFKGAPPKGAKADFDKQMAAPAGDDAVFVVAPDMSVAQLLSTVLGLTDDKLNLRFEGAERTVKLDRLLGVVFAAHPKLPPPAGPFQMFVFSTGATLAGTLLAVADDALEIETLWKSRLNVPASEVVEIRCRNGKVTSLADLEPIAVEEVPYFGRLIGWRRDQGFDGEPQLIKGKQPSRTIAMHSRCRLTYELGGQYEKLKTTIGFDDSGANRGRVACRVLVDGRTAFTESDLRADADPRPLEIPLSGAKQLILEVDFGEGEDVGDRVIWADPRLFRSSAS